MSASTAADYAAQAAVTELGDGETAVLMLHGLGGDRNQPLGLLGDASVDPALHILAPDQRAHGETGVIGEASEFTLDALADDASAVLAAHGLAERPLIVVGISMGAAVALRLAERADHDLRGALLIRPAFESEPWPLHLRGFRMIARLLREQGPSGLDEYVATAEHRAILAVSPAGARSQEEQFTKPGAVERVVRLEHVPANPSITWSGAWTPPCPVTVVGAALDPVHPMRVAELWHERIQPSELVRLPSRDREPEAYARDLQETTLDRLSRWKA